MHAEAWWWQHHAVGMLFFFFWQGWGEGWRKIVANTGSNTDGGCRGREVRVEVHEAPCIQT